MTAVDREPAKDPGHASLVFIQREDGAVLSVWNRKYHVWGLPSGKVDPGETLEHAARRELDEETGIEPWEYNYALAEIYTMPTYSGSGRVCHVFRPVDSTRNYKELFPMALEVGTGVAWMTREFLENTPTTGPWFKEFFAFLEGARA